MLGMLIFVASCSKDTDVEIVFDDTKFETTEWTCETLAKTADSILYF